MEDDIYYKGENIQPEDHKVFFGSWYRIHPESQYEEGFSLFPDSSAFSINMSTLLYRKWKIKNDKLILTSISLGNHSASVGDEVYDITSYNHKRMYLERGDRRYIYEKRKRAIPTDKVTISSGFEYFPVDNLGVNHISESKHPLDFESSKKSKYLETVISEGYKNNKRDFANHYTVITWGCGTGCQEGVIVDIRDGKIYNLPSEKGYSIGNRLSYKLNSILLVVTSILPTDGSRQPNEQHYWLWNESSKEFVRYQ